MKSGKRRTAEEVTEGVDLTGKTALITGVNSGIGQETLRVLSLRGAHVIGTGRTLAKAEEGCAVATGTATAFECELSDLDSIRRCTEKIRSRSQSLDIIVANAGIMTPAKLNQANGIELQFATNHLGHFLLLTSLMELFSIGCRVVIVSSEAHRATPRGGIDFGNLSGENGYRALRAYAQSKLANILFANSLSRRLAGRGTVNSLHPGLVRTNMGRHINPAVTWGLSLFMFSMAKTIPQGAATSCLLAASPAVEGITGKYFSDCQEKTPSALAMDDALGERLWSESQRLVSQ
jgi:WW domain-containing oxidoreductase